MRLPRKSNRQNRKRTVKERRQQVLTVLTHMLHSERGMERMTTARLAEEVGCQKRLFIVTSQVKPKCLKR